MSEEDIEVRKGEEEVSVDMWEGFPKVIQRAFPNARTVYDRFHVMQPVNRELNKLRRIVKVTRRKAKYLLLKPGKDLNTEGWEELHKIFCEHH